MTESKASEAGAPPQTPDRDWLDEEGCYPTDAALARIREWDWRDARGLMDFVRSLWWPNADWFTDNGDGTFAISTAGWSGNESMIEAMGDNFGFWALCWKSSRRGGHYEFDLTRVRPTGGLGAQPPATEAVAAADSRKDGDG